MVLVEKTVKVSSKGQITLPKQARQMLGGAMIPMVVESGQVRLEPARNLAGRFLRSEPNPGIVLASKGSRWPAGGRRTRGPDCHTYFCRKYVGADNSPPEGPALRWS